MIRTINPYTKRLRAERLAVVKEIAPRVKLSPEAQDRIYQERAASQRKVTQELYERWHAIELADYQGA